MNEVNFDGTQFVRDPDGGRIVPGANGHLTGPDMDSIMAYTSMTGGTADCGQTWPIDVVWDKSKCPLLMWADGTHLQTLAVISSYSSLTIAVAGSGRYLVWKGILSRRDKEWIRQNYPWS